MRRMDLQPITKARFDALTQREDPERKRHARALLALAQQSGIPVNDLVEQAWWADPSERALGLVFFDAAEKDWSWAVLIRKENGAFRPYLGAPRPSRDDAINRMQDFARSLLRCGQSIFPQSVSLN
jgi:hypothetical protein